MAAVPRSATDIKEHPRSALFHAITTAAAETPAIVCLLADAMETQRHCVTIRAGPGWRIKVGSTGQRILIVVKIIWFFMVSVRDRLPSKKY